MGLWVQEAVSSLYRCRWIGARIDILIGVTRLQTPRRSVGRCCLSVAKDGHGYVCAVFRSIASFGYLVLARCGRTIGSLPPTLLPSYVTCSTL